MESRFNIQAEAEIVKIKLCLEPVRIYIRKQSPAIQEEHQYANRIAAPEVVVTNLQATDTNEQQAQAQIQVQVFLLQQKHTILQNVYDEIIAAAKNFFAANQFFTKSELCKLYHDLVNKLNTALNTHAEILKQPRNLFSGQNGGEIWRNFNDRPQAHLAAIFNAWSVFGSKCLTNSSPDTSSIKVIKESISNFEVLCLEYGAKQNNSLR